MMVPFAVITVPLEKVDVPFAEITGVLIVVPVVPVVVLLPVELVPVELFPVEPVTELAEPEELVELEEFDVVPAGFCAPVGLALMPLLADVVPVVPGGFGLVLILPLVELPELPGPVGLVLMLPPVELPEVPPLAPPPAPNTKTLLNILMPVIAAMNIKLVFIFYFTLHW